LVRRKEKKIKGFTVEYIDRNKNAEADELANAVAHNTVTPHVSNPHDYINHIFKRP
jgi:hypothetical protein